jgi:two-component system OmpR family sensor kinase
MSIRLRLTLLYTVILSLTLIIFGVALYTIQARYTWSSLEDDLKRSASNVAQNSLRMIQHPKPPEGNSPPPPPLQVLSDEEAFTAVREREIVRVLDPNGNLIASPPGSDDEALPLTAGGLQALSEQHEWWETTTYMDERFLVYNRPVIVDGQVILIVQVARSLTERDRSLSSLSLTLVLASLLTTLVAFGIGWVLSGAALRSIHRVTQTAQEIGNESDFTRRVSYKGPNDEIGQLATTFNSMLARLEDAYQRVSYALKMQRDFVADVSHELRTPLTTVRGNLALLSRTPALPPDEQEDILADLVEESDRLIRLVNDLLVLARADSGRNLVKEPVKIHPIIEETCRQARQLNQQREIIAENPDEGMKELTALGDRDALKQVLLILLDNALKHSRGTIQVATQATGTEIIISVSDKGPGIPPNILEHLFDRFYRDEADPTVPGFGLGLPIAKALVEGQNGRITIESLVGSGSTVRVNLPQAPALSRPHG